MQSVHRILGTNISRDAQIIDKADQATFDTYRTKIKWLKADETLLTELHKRLAFVELNWIKKAATRGVDGEAALSYYKTQLK